MGGYHLQAIRRGGIWDVAGVVDLDSTRLVGLGCPVDSELIRALESLRPAAAIVAVPPGQHGVVARTCLDHGCHVLLEKPICSSFEASCDLAASFRREGRVLFGGHSERFHPAFLALRGQLGRIGDVVRVESVRYGPRPENVPEGGVVLDLAIHDLDLLSRVVECDLHVEGAEIERVGWHEARVLAELGWSRGKGLVDAAWRLERQRVLCVTGKKGNLEADLLARTLSLRTPAGEERIDFAWNDPLEAEQAAFLAACEGRFDAATDLRPQIEAIRVAEQILSF